MTEKPERQRNRIHEATAIIKQKQMLETLLIKIDICLKHCLSTPIQLVAVKIMRHRSYNKERIAANSIPFLSLMVNWRLQIRADTIKVRALSLQVGNSR